jgi:hypothetical protein
VNKPVSRHTPSQADYLDNSQTQNSIFPPAPVATTRQSNGMDSYDMMMGRPSMDGGAMMGPMAANSLLGGSFGASF